METIVILHGWGSSAEKWLHIKQALQSKGLNALVPDLPGFGKSVLPQTAWQVSDYVNWLKNFCDKQNISQFFLFGHSFGGRIAIKFAAQYPKKLKGLILCASAGIKPKRNFFALAAAKIGKAIFSLPLLNKAYLFLRKVFYVKILRKTDYFNVQGIMKEIFQNVINEDLIPYLSKIKTTTLILWGKQDKLTPVKDAYLMHQQIKGSHLEVFDGVGHSLRRENPELLVKKITEFVK